MSQVDLLSRAGAEHRAGRFAQAETLYGQILAAEPDHLEALYAYGVLFAQTGRLPQSLDLLTRASRQAPDDTRIGRNLALIQQAAGHADEAERQFRHLVELEPANSEFRFGLALLASSRGRFAESIDHFREGLRWAPADVDAWCNLGLACRAGGRLDEAVEAFSRAVALAPASAKGHGNLGGTYFAAGRWSEAVSAWQRALDLEPSHTEIKADMGIALANLGRRDEAVECFRDVAGQNPGNASHLFNLGRALQDLGRVDEALEAYGAVTRLDTGHASAHLNCGVILKKMGRADEALAAYDRSVAARPGHGKAHLNRSKLLYELGRLDEAIVSARSAVTLDAGDADARSELVHLLKHVCDWDGLAEAEEQCRRMVRSGVSGVDPFVFLSVPATPAEHLACARLWAADIEAETRKIEGGPPSVIASTRAGQRIRLGYLSADFHEHATAYLTAEMFERHDRSRFEVFAYSMGPNDRSQVRARLEAAFEHFRDAEDLSHAEVARQIRGDGIDILVDLKGYTKNARPQILAARPAPLQVSFLGYPGTMGAGFMDYILADAVVLPFAEQPAYDERIVHLPHCYQPNDTRRKIADVVGTRREHGLPEDGFVFCCFNNTYKIMPEVFALWMGLLKAIPGSVLWLLEANAMVRKNLVREAVRNGVDADRLVFAPKLRLAEHLARHRLADLFLDTLPYNAHTTASDALWAGLPVLTHLGDGFAGRVAASLLTASDLPELITRSWAQYSDLAVALARDSERLAALRAGLDAGRGRSKLFDCAGFTRHLEAAYGRMWQIHKAGRPPESFAV